MLRQLIRRLCLPPSDANDNIVENWLFESRIDLKSADLLYNGKVFSRALYFLQQSNEKLAKGLLLSIGFLTPKTAKKEWTVKSCLGFLPKEPVAYRHKTLPSLLSDVEKSVPAIEDFLTLLESSDLKPRITAFHKTIRTSKKGVQKLKKKPFSLVQTAEQLDIEIRYAQTILDTVDQVTNKANQELDKLDPKEIVRVATLLVQKVGLKVVAQPLPSFQKIKEEAIRSIKLAMLASLSVSIASLLDPLESVTRYPDSQHCSFDENSPYVMHFKGLYDVVARCLKKADEESMR